MSVSIPSLVGFRKSPDKVKPTKTARGWAAEKVKNFPSFRATDLFHRKNSRWPSFSPKPPISLEQGPLARSMGTGLSRLSTAPAGHSRKSPIRTLFTDTIYTVYARTPPYLQLCTAPRTRQPATRRGAAQLLWDLFPLSAARLAA